MKDRLVNSALLLSLVANLLLFVGWLRRSGETLESSNASQTNHAVIILPSKRNQATVGDSVAQAEIALPWDLLKYGPFQVLDSDDLSPSPNLPSSLDLTKNETQVFRVAATRLGNAWRKLEVAGLHAEDTEEAHIVTIQINQSDAEAAFQTFLTDIHTVMRPDRLRMFEDIVSRDPLLRKLGTTKLQISEQRSGLRFSLEANGRGHEASMTPTLVKELAQRWNHVIDFEPLSDVLNASNPKSASNVEFKSSNHFFLNSEGLDSID